MNKRQISNEVNDAVSILIEQLELNPNVVYKDKQQLEDLVETLNIVVHSFDAYANEDEI